MFSSSGSRRAVVDLKEACGSAAGSGTTVTVPGQDGAASGGRDGGFHGAGVEGVLNFGIALDGPGGGGRDGTAIDLAIFAVHAPVQNDGVRRGV